MIESSSAVRFGYQAEIDAKAVTISSSGENTIHTPTSGRILGISYLCASADADNTASVTVGFRFGTGAPDLYKLSLAAGCMWARAVGVGKRWLRLPATDVPLLVNLSSAQTVHVSIEYEEMLV